MPKAAKISTTPTLAERNSPSPPISRSKSSEPVADTWRMTPASSTTPDPTWMIK